MKIDTHCHTTYSDCGMGKPRDVLKVAMKRLDGIAITDHNTVKGSLVCKKLARTMNKKFLVITGSEIRTIKGDILGRKLGFIHH